MLHSCTNTGIYYSKSVVSDIDCKKRREAYRMNILHYEVVIYLLCL